jgi:7-carboxy-7-deazaguanine synthase
MINSSEIKRAPHKLIVNEIFHSIQGESSFVGQRCVFVRLTYCNLRCTYCDTAYAFEEGKEMDFEEILTVVRNYGCPLVEITGGEPMLQPNACELMSLLCNEGFSVLLETGGSLSLEKVDTRVRKIVDFKCPSSGMVKKNLWEIVKSLATGDEVKFVIGSREDYEWSKNKIAEYRLEQKCAVLMSVVFGELEPIRLAEWILADRLNVRYQLQAHKYIWHPEARGV